LDLAFSERFLRRSFDEAKICEADGFFFCGGAMSFGSRRVDADCAQPILSSAHRTHVTHVTHDTRGQY
jgi:hypothetical protein